MRRSDFLVTGSIRGWTPFNGYIVEMIQASKIRLGGGQGGKEEEREEQRLEKDGWPDLLSAYYVPGILSTAR